MTYRMIAKSVLQTGLALPFSIRPLQWLAETVLKRLGRRYPTSVLVDRLCSHYASAISKLGPSNSRRVATLHNGALLAVILEDYFHRRLYFSGVYESEVTSVILSILRPGDVFFDIGANAGYYSILSAKQSVEVHSFEPNHHMISLLKLSSQLNQLQDRIIINEVAVSREDGSADLLLSNDPNNTGLSSIVPLSYLTDADRVQVPTVSLDSYCKRQSISRVRLIKIDVEGAEGDVLAGAARLLSQLRPDAIICELGDFEGGASARHIVRILDDARYTMYEITQHGLTLSTRDLSTWVRHDGALPPNVCFVRADDDTGLADRNFLAH